jgi:glucan phosphoethanolaminetransferase (alkaline phosphatase superfamily)
MNKLKWQLEFFFLLFLALLAVGLLYPVRVWLPDYQFLISHFVFIAAFVTFTRNLFLLRFSFLAGRQLLKVLLFFTLIPLVFFFISEINAFQTALDEEGATGLLGKSLPYEDESILLYIRNQFLFFGVGSVITASLLGLHLIRSTWRFHNRGVD